jgi:mRNA interferase MazF
MEKDFIGWHVVKEDLQSCHNTPVFQEREVWWCSVGINIGGETDGKSRLYNRPVLIVRKFNRHLFVGVPLTTQIKQNPYYFPVAFKGKDQCVMLSQLRTWEGKRLTHKMGQMPKSQFADVRRALAEIVNPRTKYCQGAECG